MSNSYKEIDEKTWERAVHCAVFRNSFEPAFCVTFEIDMPISVQAHHSFVDGIHIGKFADRLQQYMNESRG